MTTQITTPCGRIVWGNPLVGRQKEKNGQKVMKDGKAVMEYTFGLAIPKAEFGEIGAALQAEAQAACPQGVPPDFAFKVKDGDKDVDKNGQPLSAKQGYAGHFVLSVSTEYPIPVFKRNGAAFAQINDGVKTGDYVRAQITINGHGRAPGVTGSKPGLYLNPNMVEFLGYGEAILGAANPDAAFGAPVALPQGASATPTAQGPMPAAPQVQAPFATQTQSPPPPPATPNTNFPWGGGS